MAKDIFHDVVRKALEQEGWIVTDDPFFLKWGKATTYIDLGAEKLLTAIKQEKKIAVEIKTFSDISPMFAFHVAVGQFVNYRVMLDELEPDRDLFLAVPDVIYDTFLQSEFAQAVIQQQNIKLIIYDPELGVIRQWIS
ncbi:MAG: element excision factor XisH family protein [Snowella sp.]|nr:element excision factor XisH family protein [Snowella sp.]